MEFWFVFGDVVPSAGNHMKQKQCEKNRRKAIDQIHWGVKRLGGIRLLSSNFDMEINL